MKINIQKIKKYTLTMNEDEINVLIDSLTVFLQSQAKRGIEKDFEEFESRERHKTAINILCFIVEDGFVVDKLIEELKNTIAAKNNDKTIAIP